MGCAAFQVVIRDVQIGKSGIAYRLPFANIQIDIPAGKTIGSHSQL
jgi:hypothetical protein